MAGSVDTAVILAAGRGTRLGARGRSTPKGFIELGGRPIVERSLDLLAAAGVERVVIVTGHVAERYDDLARRRAGLVTTVHNAEFERSGSLWSLHCARDAIVSDFLLLESDIVYERRALSAVLGATQEDVVLVSGPTASGDEVWVEAPGGRLAAMSKDRSRLGSDVLGELVGISRISLGLLSEIAREIDRRPEGSRALEYETGGLVVAAARRAVHCLLVPDLAWCEIDDEAHLARARDAVYPRIIARDREERARTPAG